MTLTTETAKTITDAITSSVASDKATAKCNEKTRTALDAVYKEVSQGAPMTEDLYKTARAIILEECRKAKSWPISEKTDEKSGYQSAMKAGCSSAIWYNKAQALLQLDLKNFKAQLNDQNEVNLALELTPEQREVHKQTIQSVQQQEKIASTFHAFISLFASLPEADQAFQSLLETAKKQQKK